MICWLTSLFFLLGVAAASQPEADLQTLQRIRAEALQSDAAIEVVKTLSDRFGPRLTGSPEWEASAEWLMSQMRQWKLANVHAERWGPFGRAWSLKRFSLHQTSPGYANLIGVPLAWSASTKGVVSAEPILIPIEEMDLEKYEAAIHEIEKRFAGKLSGKVVLMSESQHRISEPEQMAYRYSAADLLQEVEPTDLRKLESFNYRRLALPEDMMARIEFMMHAPGHFKEQYRNRQQQLRRRLHSFLRSENAVAILVSSPDSRDRTVFATSAGWWQSAYPSPLPVISIGVEHYGRIARLIEAGTTVRLELELQAEISSADVHPANIIAEVPGTTKADEWVLVGAHLDSWTGGTGATDNAAGCAVVLEAMRILKALHLKLDRSVRVLLWSGEEQGTLGSEAYIRKHFSNAGSNEHRHVSAYFNLDDGAGKIRGIYLQGNKEAGPLLRRWLMPLRDLGASTVSIRHTGPSDLSPFDESGIPAFGFIQDPLDYWTRTHHSNMDTFEHVQPDDLKQSATVLASILYQAANHSSLIPRKSTLQKMSFKPN